MNDVRFCPRCLDPLVAARVGRQAPVSVPAGPFRSLTTDMPMSADQVEIDRCQGCGGVWLDAGELARVLNDSLTENGNVERAAEAPTKRPALEGENLRLLVLLCTLVLRPGISVP